MTRVLLTVDTGSWRGGWSLKGHKEWEHSSGGQGQVCRYKEHSKLVVQHHSHVEYFAGPELLVPHNLECCEEAADADHLLEPEPELHQ